jgi:hypothetical protein
MPAPGTIGRFNPDSLTGPWTLYDAAGTAVLVNTGAAAIRVGGSGGSVGFYGTAPIALQTGVAVTAEGIHAALVALGLIAA